MKSAFILASLIPLLVFAQDSSCPAATEAIIQTCTDQVIADEGKAPCSSSDWPCICQHQEGLIACHAPCPEIQDFDDIRFNNENCKGQNGVTNAAGGNPQGTYTLSPITTTAEGSNGAAPTAPNVSSSAASSSAPASTGAASSSAPSSASTAAASSSASAAPNAGTHVVSAFVPSALFLVLGGLALGIHTIA